MYTLVSVHVFSFHSAATPILVIATCYLWSQLKGQKPGRFSNFFSSLVATPEKSSPMDFRKNGSSNVLVATIKYPQLTVFSKLGSSLFFGSYHQKSDNSKTSEILVATGSYKKR